AVNQAQFAIKIDAFHAEQLHFPRLDLILGEAFADERNAGIGAYEAFDHAYTGQLHRNVNPGTVGTEKLVENLAGVTRTGEDERLTGDFFQRHLGTARQRVFAADHEAHAVFVNVVDLEVWRFQRHGDDADVHRTVFDALQDLVAEIAVDTDVDLRIFALKFSEYVRQKIEASSFVGAENHRALNDVAAIGDDLDRLVAQAQEAFGVVEQDFAGGCQLNGLGGSIEEFGAIGLFELANLGADGGL